MSRTTNQSKKRLSMVLFSFAALLTVLMIPLHGMSSDEDALLDRLAGSAEDRKARALNEAKRDNRNACKQARDEFKQWSKDIAEACDQYGVGENCIQEAAQCSMGGSSNGQGGWSNMAQMLGMAGAQYFGGAGAMVNPMMQMGNTKCQPKASVEKLKESQKDLYKDARESAEKAKETVADIEKEKDRLTDEGKDLQEKYLDAVQDAQLESNNLNQKLREKREEYEKKTVELMSGLSEVNERMATALQVKSQSASAITQLYPAKMGACMDIYNNQSIANDKELLAIQLQLQTQLEAETDLRRKRALEQQLLNKLKAQEAMRIREGKASYQACIKKANFEYNKEYKELKAIIAKADRDVELHKKQLKIGQDKLKTFSDSLAEELQAIKKEIAIRQDDQKKRLALLQAATLEKVNNFNSRLATAKQNELQKERELMQREGSFRQSQAMAEASLGRVGPLLDDYAAIKTAMCESCEEAGMAPSLCNSGSDPFEEGQAQ